MVPTLWTDRLYGRRGGGWLPRGYEPVDLSRLCDVCGEPLTCGQLERHASCEPAAAELFPNE